MYQFRLQAHEIPNLAIFLVACKQGAKVDMKQLMPMSGCGMRILYYDGSEDDPNIQFIDASLEGLGESAHIEVNSERVELSEVESVGISSLADMRSVARVALTSGRTIWLYVPRVFPGGITDVMINNIPATERVVRQLDELAGSRDGAE